MVHHIVDTFWNRFRWGEVPKTGRFAPVRAFTASHCTVSVQCSSTSLKVVKEPAQSGVQFMVKMVTFLTIIHKSYLEVRATMRVGLDHRNVS